MKASINKNIVHITGKKSEQQAIEKVINIMMTEFNSMALIEDLVSEMCEYTLSYASEEATVATVKESYSDAKQRVTK